jgi:glycosyltransferase involved in cell wall biosynthesis
VKQARDAFLDGAEVPSHLRAERTGSDRATPLMTIAIPTFNRADLLREAIASALDQPGAPSYEVIVVDNDSAPAAVDAALADLPADPAIDLRYFVNASNIGMFANWNRCMTLARGTWVTILNDDDVLRPDFLRRFADVIARRSDIDGLVCHKELLDRRPADKREAPPGTSRAIWRRLIDARFDRDALSRVTPRTLFWGNELGNGLGFLFRRDLGIALGGYQPEEWPSADYYFYARFAIAHRMFLMRDVLADVGIGENESMRPEALMGFARKDMDLRDLFVADGHVPRGWSRHSAQITATFLAQSSDFWHVRFDPAAIREAFGALPPPASLRLRLARLARRAY